MFSTSLSTIDAVNPAALACTYGVHLSGERTNASLAWSRGGVPVRSENLNFSCGVKQGE
jgi:hypothetical protein